MTSPPSTPAIATDSARRTDWVAVARQLDPTFAARASTHGATDAFVADNYRDLRDRKVFSAGVPADLGGGGLFRTMGLERLLRDIHAAQFHPLQAKRQHRFSGRLALGLEPIA